MLKLTSVLLALIQLTVCFSPISLPGDVNGDDALSIEDASALLTAIADGSDDPLCDVTGDGVVSIRDVTSLLCMLAAPAEEENYGDAVVIRTVEDLQQLRDDPTADAVLVNDLEITGAYTPIGNASVPYSGSFDGLGHTVTLALTENSSTKATLVGMFGYVTGSIEHLNFEGSINASIDSGHIGSAAAILTGGGRVYDCTSSVDITADCTTASAIGGLVGSVYASSEVTDGTLRLCTNNGSITATVTTSGAGDGSPLTSGTTGAIGGLLGLSVEGAATEVYRCVNNGDITVTGGKYNIGGVVGQTSSTANSTTIAINECANKGDVTVYKLSGERAAGIIGYIKGGSIVNCYNVGSVIAYSDMGSTVSRAGYGTYYGIFGYANLGSSNKLTVTGCYSATPNPLEAEICVVRNAKYGTFANYYMEGRTEYERDLNASNVSSGNAGTTFTSAADLTGKLVPASNGVYKAAGENEYPILTFETANALPAPADGAEISYAASGSEKSLTLTIQLYASDVYEEEALFRLALHARDGSVTTRNFPLSALRSVESITADDMTYTAAEDCKLYEKVVRGLTYENFNMLEMALVIPGEVEDTIVCSNAVGYTDFYEAPAASSVGLGQLPEYPNGKVSAIYNAGPGLENDKLSTTATDCREVVISGTDADAFAEYTATLEEGGFEKVFENAIENNQFRLYQKDGKTYYFGYFGNVKELRIVEDNASTGLVTEIPGGEATVEPKIWQYALDFTKGTGQTSGHDYYAIDCGMSYVIRLADNTLFMIDGGHQRQSSDAALEAENAFLHEITGTPANEKVTIAGWYFTHAHGDHVYFSHAFLEKYHDLYDVKALYCNFPSYQTMPSGYDGGTFKMKDTLNAYYPDCDCYKLHTGETFTLPGATFEVLYTHEDAVQKITGVTNISDFNSSSTVIRLTIGGKTVLFLGDVSGTADAKIRESYTSATLHSDAVQLAHHCINNLPNLYSAIAAPLILCPNSKENVDTNHSTKRQGAITGAGSAYRGIIYEGDYTYCLSFDGDEISYEIDRPIYTTALYFENPGLGFAGEQVAELPVSTTVLNGLTDVSSLVIDKSARGTTATGANEAAQRIFDGDTGTKWCCTNIENAYVMFKTKAPTSVAAYQLCAANDTAGFSGRNPKSWTLYGSADGENWTVIDSVYSGTMNTANYSASTYRADSDDAEFSYFVLYIHTITSGTTMQISELKLFA